MKKTFTLIIFIALSLGLIAQTPEQLSYQAVVRDGGNNLVTNQTVGVQISILQGSANGSAVYVETHTPQSNDNGLVTFQIGSGTAVSGNFTTINWGSDSYFVQMDMDPAGGTNYTITGTHQLLSVPYALHAKTAESISGGINETDPVFSGSVANGISQTDVDNWNNPQITLTGDETVFDAWDKDASDDFSGDYNDLLNLPDFTDWDTNVSDDFDGNYSNLSGVPTNISHFNNDVGYLTTDTTLTETEVDAFVANNGYLTGVDGTETAFDDWDKDATDDFDGDYNKLINLPDLSVYSTTDTTLNENEVDAFVSNNGYALQTGLTDTAANIRGNLAAIATTGNYEDLLNAPDLSDTANYADQAALEDTASSLRNDLAPKTNLLTLDNTTAFTPDADYEPATKKYVDDNVGGSAHYVGELYGGGIVFWVSPDGQHGLIASLDDIDGGSGVTWSNVTSEETGANSQTDGASNIALIIAQTGHTASAAKLCDDYMGGGFTDWYLPSNREFDLLASQDILIDYILDNDGDANTNGFSQEFVAPAYGRYWTSTENGSYEAWVYRFYTGYPNNRTKSGSYKVRAIRAF